MKKFFTRCVTLIIIVLTISGCSSLKYSYRQVEIPEQSLLVMPVLVDVDVDLSQKITAISPRVKGVENAISTAYYYALQNSGADVIIDPVYFVKTTGHKSVATVTGFYGKYTKARKIVDALPEFEKLDKENFEKVLMLINGFQMPTTPTKESTTGKQRRKALKNAK